MAVIESVRIPDSLFKQVQTLVDREGITLEQFICSAIAEKADAWASPDYLRQRAARGSREKFLQALSQIPDAEPDEHDRLD